MLYFILMSVSLKIHGQVDQNFKVRGKTDCNDIGLQFSSMEEAEQKIHGTNFNIQEEMNTSRISGYRKAHYRSCNMKDGFLLLQRDENWIIHRNIPYEVWQEYFKSRDLEGFYKERIKDKYPLVTDPV